MTDKEQIAKLQDRLEQIALLLNLDPAIPDRWVGHIETRIQEWHDDREAAWLKNKVLVAESKMLWAEINEGRTFVRRTYEHLERAWAENGKLRTALGDLKWELKTTKESVHTAPPGAGGAVNG